MPKERVRLDADTDTEEQPVSDTVRSDHIEVEAGGDRPRCV